MLGSNRSSRPRRKILISDINPSILCSQCTGYLIDATSLVDCLHTYCRACILKHFEASGKVCPTCNMDYRKRSYSVLRRDVQLQTLVYKMVGGLHSKEKQRRHEFYSSTGVRASSSCSDDSLLEDIPDHEPYLSSADSIEFYSPEDSISLSLEYYQNQLDTFRTYQNSKKQDNSSCQSKDLKDNTKENNNSDNSVKSDNDLQVVARIKPRDRRYLQCPAAVEMTHLQKFIRMKYGLSIEHKVDIIYQGEVLPSYLNLMDVAYSFDWHKVKPMRFFYRIFTHTKVQSIKIINTTSSLGAKQLQIVTIEPPQQKSIPKNITSKSPVVSPIVKSPPKPSAQIVSQKIEEPISNKHTDLTQQVPTIPQMESKSKSSEMLDNSRSYTSKEHLMAHLQLQPNRDINGKRLVEPRKTPERSPEVGFVREYPEPDKEEIKRFAEKRDREWRMLAEKDESTQQHVNKKRKKSKHSKSDVTHKKRKLHAEITPSDEKQESIKLKLKVTQVNGHKHRHRSGSTPVIDENPVQPQLQPQVKLTAIDSSKQELLKLRGVRHKNISHNDDKTIVSKQPVDDTKRPSKPIQEEPKPVETKTPVHQQSSKIEQQINSKLRCDLTHIKSTKELSEQHEKQTFLKTFQPGTKDHKKPTAEKIATPSESEKMAVGNKIIANNKMLASSNNNINSTVNNQKLMERKLEILKQECTVEPKQNKVATLEKKPSLGINVNNMNPIVVTQKLKIQPDKPKIINNQFATNPEFTVSKIENSVQGFKRKLDKPAQITDHRPSLEITVIPQVATSVRNQNTPSHPIAKRPTASPSAVSVPGTTKRPPPDTIPLDRIMKSNVAAMNKAGVSITPSKPISDINPTSVGVLDLSQKLTTIEFTKSIINNNGLKQQVLTNSKIVDNKGLSNLQMLSKVATEQVLSKPPKLIRAQIPNLQSINSFQPKPMPNLTKISKLNEMSQFRNAQANNGSIRTMVRPQIQNQSIRNIPNPSLLVRQQNQNRMINLTSATTNADKLKPIILNNGCKESQMGNKSVVIIEGKEKADSVNSGRS